MIFNLSNLFIFIVGHLTKSGSESSLSDACETSAKESARTHEEKDICSDNEEPGHAETESKEEIIESCDESKQVYDNEKDVEEEKENLTHRSKLQKQGNVVLRRKSKGNPLYRKSMCNQQLTIGIGIKFANISHGIK